MYFILILFVPLVLFPIILDVSIVYLFQKIFKKKIDKIPILLHIFSAFIKLIIFLVGATSNNPDVATSTIAQGLMDQIHVFTPNTVTILLNSILVMGLCIFTIGYFVLRIRYKYSLTTIIAYLATNLISFTIYFTVLQYETISISRSCINAGGC